MKPTDQPSGMGSTLAFCSLSPRLRAPTSLPAHPDLRGSVPVPPHP